MSRLRPPGSNPKRKNQPQLIETAQTKSVIFNNLDVRQGAAYEASEGEMACEGKTQIIPQSLYLLPFSVRVKSIL